MGDEVETEIEKKKIEKLAQKGIVRKIREKERKNKKRKTGQDLDFHDFQDNVSFGETVDAPPTLKYKKFVKSASSKPAAEGKSELLLRKGVNGVKKAKLSMAQKVKVEKDRQHVVEMYRQLKAQKVS